MATLGEGCVWVRCWYVTPGKPWVPELGVFMVTTNGVGYGPKEGTLYGSSVVMNAENMMGQTKGRGGRSNMGIWPLFGTIFSVKGCASVLRKRLGRSQE